MENNQVKKEKSILKRWRFWCIVVIVIIGITAASGCEDEPKKIGETKSTSSSSSSSVSTNSSKTKTFKVGDIIKLKNYKVTVNKVYIINPTDILTPNDGNEFLGVDCTIENTSNEQQSLSSIMMFKVVDKDGRSCEYSLSGVSAANAGQLDGDIGVGRKITGVYAVEVKKGITGLQLEFDGSLIGDQQIIVQLN